MSLCVCVYHIPFWCMQRPQWGIRYPKTALEMVMSPLVGALNIQTHMHTHTSILTHACMCLGVHVYTKYTHIHTSSALF